MKFNFTVLLCFLSFVSFGQSDDHWSGLPLFKSAFEKEGMTFPKPFGVGVASMYMNQDYRMTNMQINGEDIDFFRINKATGNDLIVMPRLDVWLFPFLNAYVFAGGISGQLDMNVSVQDPDIPIIQFDVPLNFQYTGMYFGAGANITMALNNWFTMVDGNYSRTQLSSFDSQLKMLMISARFGYIKPVNSKNWMFWIGTMYQGIEQRLQQEQDGSLISVEVAADRPLNLLLGTKYDISKSIGFMVEAGFVGRTQLIGHVEYRF